MTSLISSVQSINIILINELPAGKPMKLARAVRIDSECLFITEDGRIYTSRSKGWAFMPGEASRRRVTALYKLGAITKADMEKHNAICEANVRRREVKWAADNIADAAKTLGIKLTAAQKAVIAKAEVGAK